MSLDLFEEACRIPILAAVDPGKSGYVVKNDKEGRLEAHKSPLDESGGIDISAYMELLTGSDLVIMEHVPMVVAGPSRVSEESCHCQYMQLYGMLETMGALGMLVEGFYTISPTKWQDYLGFPRKSQVTLGVYDKKLHGHLPEDEQRRMKGRANTAWKEFFLDQSKMRFPKQKITKDAAEAFLLYDVTRKLYATPRDQWP